MKSACLNPFMHSSSSVSRELERALRDRTLAGSDVVNTGFVPSRDIHLYVFYCMKQVVLHHRDWVDVFRNGIVCRALTQKMKWIEERNNYVELEKSGQRLYDLGVKESYGYKGNIARILHSLVRCLSTDPYEAHANTAFAPLNKDPDLRNAVLDTWQEERRNFMLRLLEGEIDVAKLRLKWESFESSMSEDVFRREVMGTGEFSTREEKTFPYKRIPPFVSKLRALVEKRKKSSVW